MGKRENFFDQLISIISNLRRKNNIETNFEKFKRIIECNIHNICQDLNTRLLISICDTYADFGTPIEQRNALIISVLINMEKLAQTHLLLYDIKLNHEKIILLRKGEKFPLWDGMTSFNLKGGDLTNNMLKRIIQKLDSTPLLLKIFNTLLSRLREYNTILNNLNYYHKNVFNTTPKKKLKDKIKKHFCSE